MREKQLELLKKPGIERREGDTSGEGGPRYRQSTLVGQ